MTAAIFICTAAFAVSGCGSSDNSYRTNINGGSDAYNQDGYLGYTNSNPNLPNRLQATSYGTDSAFVNQMVRSISGVDDVRLMVNGKKMNVHLLVNKKLSDRQIRKLRMEAQSKVQFNMPKYEVHVQAERSK